MALSSLEHLRENVGAETGGNGQVEPQDRFDLVRTLVGDPTGSLDSGVVDEDVDRSGGCDQPVGDSVV